MFANKKVWISTVLVVVLFVGGLLGFVIIPNELNKFRPASWEKGTSTTSVSGNGGTAVMVGHYLYFTSGYISKASIKYKQNEYGKIKKQGQGGIWRVKMAERDVKNEQGAVTAREYDGTPTYNNSYLAKELKTIEYNDYEMYLDMDRFDTNQDEKIKKAMDKYISKGNIELIVPKIAGWENSALWIYGNNLVYTTPNNEKDRKGVLQSDKIDYYRCDLTGANNKRIYTTRTDNKEGEVQHTVVWATKPYLLVKDGSRLVRVSMGGQKSTFANGIESFIFPSVQSYYANDVMGATRDGSYSGIMGYIFYTIAAQTDSEIKGNQLWRYEVKTGKKTEITKKMPNDTVRLLAQGNGRLVYEVDTLDDMTDLYITSDVNVGHNDADKQFVPVNGIEGQATSVAVAGERMNTFNYFTVTDGFLRKWSLGNTQQVSTPIAGGSEGQEQGNVAGVLAITQMGIIYEVQNSGGYVTIDFNGNVIASNTRFGEGDGKFVALGSRVSPFHKLDKKGNRISAGGDYMLFYGTEIGEEHEHDEAIEAGHVHETWQSSMMITLDGEREYTLARVPTEFITFPTKTAVTGPTQPANA